jgi:hypothetical protein
MRELFYANVQSLKEIIDHIVYLTGDDEIAVHTRKGAGYAALDVAFSRLRYSYTVEAGLRQALAEAFGPITFGTSEELGAVYLLLYYFDAARLERPIDLERVRRITAELVTTWEDRAAVALEAAFGEREGRRLFNRWVRQESRSGIYREATPPEEVPEDLKHLESLEGRLEVRILPRTAETGEPEALLRARARAHRHPAHPPEPGADREPRSCASPWSCPRVRQAVLYRLEAGGDRRSAWPRSWRAGTASSTRCARWTRSGPRTTP